MVYNTNAFVWNQEVLKLFYVVASALGFLLCV